MVLATARTDHSRAASFSLYRQSQKIPSLNPVRISPCYIHYTFIGLLFAALPEERALQFWGSGLQQSSFRLAFQEPVESISGRHLAFSQWAVWSTPTQDLAILVALYDMLGGLANGQQCSELAYNLWQEVVGGFSRKYGVIYLRSFRLVDRHFWTPGFMGSQCGESTQPTPGSTSKTECTFRPIFPKFGSISSDVLAIRNRSQNSTSCSIVSSSFVNSCHTFRCCLYHGMRTCSFQGYCHFAFSYPLRISLELKGAIFEALAAFCRPDAGTAVVEICKAVRMF
jgi:nuclear pore complex protein Nup205